MGRGGVRQYLGNRLARYLSEPTHCAPRHARSEVGRVRAAMARRPRCPGTARPVCPSCARSPTRSNRADAAPAPPTVDVDPYSDAFLRDPDPFHEQPLRPKRRILQPDALLERLLDRHCAGRAVWRAGLRGTPNSTV